MTTVWNQVGPEAGAAIRARIGDVEVVDVPLDPDEAPAPAADVLFAAPRRDLSYEQLARAEVRWADGVPWVHTLSAGVDQYPRALLGGRRVTATKGVWSVPVAEYAVTAILAAEKRVWEIFSGAPVELFTIGLLRGRTVGIVGFGGIGQEIARRLLAFGVRVLATRRGNAPAEIDGVELTDLDGVLAQADHLVLAVPTTPSTSGLLDAERIARIKPGAHLVNVARGAVVDQDALLAALDDGTIGAATLDVTEPEPLPADHPLRAHPRAWISPHVSGAAAGMQSAAIDFFVDNLRRHVAGESLLGEVDPRFGY